MLRYGYCQYVVYILNKGCFVSVSEDILWFKPVELRTKWGRHGNIKEPLGTLTSVDCFFLPELVMIGYYSGSQLCQN